MPLYYRPAATISRTADRWYVSFTVEVQRAIPAGNGRDTVVGVDVGVRHLAVFSTGLATPNPVPSSARCASCDGSTGNYIAAGQALDAASRPDAGSRGVHARSANLRRDALHKLTTTLATQYGSVVVEQLNHKTGWYGSRLVVADRLSPSSKTCSACGWVKAKLALAERTFTCEACGLRVDRDLNAARNLATLAAQVARSGWETRNDRGADRRTQPAGQVARSGKPAARVGREAGTADSRKEAAPR